MKSQFEFERRSIKSIRNKHAVQTVQCNLVASFLTTEKMARARDDECCEFRIMHQIKFKSHILGHHVYKNAWSLCKGETLTVQPDNRDEAQENDEYVVGIYKKNNYGSKELVGPAPVEFPGLLYHFL